MLRKIEGAKSKNFPHFYFALTMRKKKGDVQLYIIHDYSALLIVVPVIYTTLLSQLHLL